MARPLKTTPKAVPCGVSLYPEERALFKRLGGTAWLRRQLAMERERSTKREHAEGFVKTP